MFLARYNIDIAYNKGGVYMVNSNQQHRDISLILIASFFYMTSPMLITPIITGFSESLGASGTMMGLIGGIMNICSLISRPIIGVYADKINKYKISSFGIICIIIACIGYTLATNSIIIMIARIINGLGFACCSTCMSTWMSDLLPQEKIGSGMGIYGTMNALSMAIAPAIGVYIYQNFNYTVAFLIATITAIISIIIIQFVQDKDEPIPAAKTNSKLELIDKNVVPIAFIMMMFAIPYCATQSFLVTYIETKQLDINISLFFPAYAIALLILRISLKSLFDKLPFGVFFTSSTICACLSMYFLNTMQNDFDMLLASVFMAGGTGILNSVCQSTALLLAPKNKRGLANSTFYIGIDLGMALGPIIAGFFYEHFPLDLFYPLFFITIPLAIIGYFFYRQKAKHILN